MGNFFLIVTNYCLNKKRKEANYFTTKGVISLKFLISFVLDITFGKSGSIWHCYLKTTIRFQVLQLWCTFVSTYLLATKIRMQKLNYEIKLFDWLLERFLPCWLFNYIKEGPDHMASDFLAPVLTTELCLIWLFQTSFLGPSVEIGSQVAKQHHSSS